MPLELTANTQAGERLDRARRHASPTRSAPRAASTTATASFPFESLAAVRQSGYLAAPVPEQLGGLGVTSVHDVVVASSRLARGDAALALGVNMHLVYVLNVVRRWQIATRGRRPATLGGVRRTLERDRPRRDVVFAAATSEIGQDITRAATTADRAPTTAGWSPATRCSAPCHPPPTCCTQPSPTTIGDDQRAVRLRDDPGATPASSSTTTGTRSACARPAATRSPSRTCTLPAAALRGGFPVGDVGRYMERNLNAGLFHAAATLGIAESANAIAVRKLAEQARQHGQRPHARRSPPKPRSISPPAEPSSTAPPP